MMYKSAYGGKDKGIKFQSPLLLLPVSNTLAIINSPLRSCILKRRKGPQWNSKAMEAQGGSGKPSRGNCGILFSPTNGKYGTLPMYKLN